MVNDVWMLEFGDNLSTQIWFKPTANWLLGKPAHILK
jgi:hypothetical protein